MTDNLNEQLDAPPAPVAIAAVLLFSENAEALARFYREQLGAPLIRVNAPAMEPHWGCEINRVYFSIWSTPQTSGVPRGDRSAIAFYVRDVRAAFERIVAAGAQIVWAPRRTALGMIARLQDPDGNLFELYQP